MGRQPSGRLPAPRGGMHVWRLLLLVLLWPGALQADAFLSRLAQAAEQRTQQTVRYDGRYFAIPYPNGDVPADVGVCTDLVIRSYRALGFDLQQAVHEDMRQQFEQYPSRRIWGLTRPDPNIDHRRVPNLQVYFQRHGQVLPVSQRTQDYQPGDLVTWMLPGNLPHIGIVSSRGNGAGGYRVAHNIGRGPVLEDMLFRYPVTGHYRFVPLSDILPQQ